MNKIQTIPIFVVIWHISPSENLQIEVLYSPTGIWIFHIDHTIKSYLL